MLLVPERKDTFSPDLEYGHTPNEPDNCSVLVEVNIGIKGQDASDIFSFVVITPKAMSHLEPPDYRWGRGWLIMEYFSWSAVESAIDKLCSSTTGVSWNQIAEELSKWLFWEFENYK